MLNYIRLYNDIFNTNATSMNELPKYFINSISYIFQYELSEIENKCMYLYYSINPSSLEEIGNLIRRCSDRVHQYIIHALNKIRSEECKKIIITGEIEIIKKIPVIEYMDLPPILLPEDSVTHLILPTRIRNILKRYNINTISDLIKIYINAEHSRIKEFGVISWRTITKAVNNQTIYELKIFK